MNHSGFTKSHSEYLMCTYLGYKLERCEWVKSGCGWMVVCPRSQGAIHPSQVTTTTMQSHSIGCEDQPKCPHFPKISLLCWQIVNFGTQYLTGTGTYTHTHPCTHARTHTIAACKFQEPVFLLNLDVKTMSGGTHMHHYSLSEGDSFMNGQIWSRLPPSPPLC